MLLTYSTPGNRNRPLMQLATVVSLLCWFSVGLAQELPQRAPEIDTAYEAQRSKVNDLLTQRSARFGDFNESLQQRTGIFGLKTKRDMQASIDILKQIVLTDNEIFKETKRLLDFKEFEKTRVVEQATEFDSRINAYIKTISKLQTEQQHLQQEIRTLEQWNRRYIGFLFLSVFALILVVGLFIRSKKLTKA